MKKTQSLSKNQEKNTKINQKGGNSTNINEKG